MTREALVNEPREFALNEADRMRILASEYRQMGFGALARWLTKNADLAMKWATRKAAK